MPTREQYEREASRRADLDEPTDIDEAINSQMRAFFEVGLQSLRVPDAAAAMELLLTSERVQRDLQDASWAGALGEMKIAVRTWDQDLRQEYEFRGFVYAGQLTQISQYNPYCYYPEQVSERKHLLATLEAYWRTQVAELLAPHFDAYVIDMAILADGSCRVIELNPFEKQTGGGLFVWEDPSDLERLKHGPLTLRLATQPRPRMQTTLEVFISGLPSEAERATARADESSYSPHVRCMSQP